VLIVTALVICASIAAVILLSTGSSHRSSASVTPASQTSGPNETARGQAAASATGASQPTQTGGPNESRRGQSAAAASRH
jgi:preprotein translocase subunit SecG